ncbi:facilitated trehalose transporter Tret1-like [Sitophilus oryzae]|uniref:Facilitated trehalose transporter Tret1-like n=1 Tax=Sitophilus oryzae TaxID=7048 RepID=A0A6J2YY73_SITOR|nr:facilitated trehalose transporter Tret1-like [Sitophilus oryzae]
MMMNVQKILTEAGSVYMDSTTSAILFAVMMLASCSVASIFIDRFGRKVLLILSGVLTGIALLAISIYFHLKYLNYDVLPISWLPAACVMIYAAIFERLIAKVGLGLVPIVITAEIFPTNVKAMGMTLADVIYVVAASASINLYNFLYNSFGIQMPFYVFSAVSFFRKQKGRLWMKFSTY